MTNTFYKQQQQQDMLAFYHERHVMFCLHVTQHYTPLKFEERMRIGRKIFWQLAKQHGLEAEDYAEVMDAYLPEELHYKNRPN